MFRYLLSLWLLVCSAIAQSRFEDRFDDVASWRALPSEGVEAVVTCDAGRSGGALRIDYHFAKGSGFVVVRRDLDLELPDNYRFTFWVRGQGSPNNLEFKLVDPTGDNVWWVNRLGFDAPADWMPLRQRGRQIPFAWGPLGGGRPERLGAIEFAVAASEGGRGTIWIDDLQLDELPSASEALETPRVRVSTRPGQVAPLADDGRLGLEFAGDASEWIELDFGGLREIGGLRLDWGAHRASEYRVRLSEDGENWRTVSTLRREDGRRDWLPLADADAALIRIEIELAADGARLDSLAVLDPTFADSPNETLRGVARGSPRGRLPRPFLDEQQFWTVVGAPEHRWELLIDEAGAVEVDRRGWRIEPMLRVAGRLWTWADVETVATLEDNELPIPTATWHGAPVVLAVTAIADESRGGGVRMLVRYRLHNPSSAAVDGELLLLARPYQILPPWQALNLLGGAAVVREIATDKAGISVAGRRLSWWTAPEEVGAAAFAGGDISELLAEGGFPRATAVEDASGLASAVMRYVYALAPGETRDVVIELDESGRAPAAGDVASPGDNFEWGLRATRERWREALGDTRLVLPSSARLWADTWRSTLAYILVNADGAAIQPGSRTYERSWIRDGAMTATALLAAGHFERVRDFIDWYAPHQYESGKVPCVVDHRGPDPVDEHDSTGQLLFLIAEYYRYTGDRAVLERHYERVAAGVEYLDALRRQRMTETYRSGTPEQRACYGLVPESISHEGYSAKPMHSYWDSLWTVRGLKDAVEIATALGRASDAERYSALRDEYRTALHASILLAMKNTGVDYIPGCVELGDFDATSTAIAYFPCDEAAHLPQAALDRTFEKYLDFFRQRRDGALAWRDYTPYELRLMQTFTLRGDPDAAHELAEYFFGHQFPPGWNHWAEVVHRDPRHPGYVGDMPHTWCGSAFMSALRAMLTHPDGNRLVLAAGVTRGWLDSGEPIGVENLHTIFGRISYNIRREGDRIHVSIDGRFRADLSGFELRLPGVISCEPVVDEDRIFVEARPGAVRLRRAAGALQLRIVSGG